MSAKLLQEFEVFKRELMLAPRQVRVRLLERVEEAIGEVAFEKTYPFDYLVYRITDHRAEETTPLLLTGEEAGVQLARLLYDVGRSVKVGAESIREPVRTIEELTARWKVSAATVLRWRHAGLAMRLLRFGGGRRKAGVRESLARRFERDRARLIRHARTRRHLSERERNVIIEEALVGLAREESPGHIVDALMQRHALTQTSINRLLTAAARENAALKALTHTSITTRESEAILEEALEGEPAEDVAARHGRPAEYVRRLVLRGRARRILRRRLKVMESEEFRGPDAEERILGERLAERAVAADASADDLPVYLKGTAGAALLTKDEEASFFRRYNYLKHKVREIRERIDARRPDGAAVAQCEHLLAEAERVRERLVRSNLRLVAAIAKRHYGRKTNFAGLVSDGNMALLDAVETFDYSRGNKFSTYAGWAIMRRFARTVPEENYRVMNVEDEILDSVARVEVDFTAAKPAAIAAGMGRALEGLGARERAVIEGRFGMGGNDRPRTLAELGAVFGVTKERIRQIEVQALERLRRIVEQSCPDIIPG